MSVENFFPIARCTTTIALLQLLRHHSCSVIVSSRNVTGTLCTSSTCTALSHTATAAASFENRDASAKNALVIPGRYLSLTRDQVCPKTFSYRHTVQIIEAIWPSAISSRTQTGPRRCIFNGGPLRGPVASMRQQSAKQTHL